jgi:5-formyltetrahydrofolate cyclo-ligase
VLRPGRFGIPEPADDDATRVDPGGADLVLVPGVAFAPGGGRVGYGGGYYDALLRGFAPHEDGPVTVGIGFEFQVCPEVPREKWDAAVDAVVTECGVRLSGSRGRPHSFRSSTRVPPTKN